MKRSFAIFFQNIALGIRLRRLDIRHGRSSDSNAVCPAAEV
jgi:hypothetical protein